MTINPGFGGQKLVPRMLEKVRQVRDEIERQGLATEVEVDGNDPAFKRPTKPIGPFFTRYRAEALERDLGWTMREDAGRGWRRTWERSRPSKSSAVRSAAGREPRPEA